MEIPGNQDVEWKHRRLPAGAITRTSTSDEALPALGQRHAASPNFRQNHVLEGISGPPSTNNPDVGCYRVEGMEFHAMLS